MAESVDKVVGYISITENLDFSTSSGTLHFRIMSAFANFERDIISERTKEGIARTKAKGTALGRLKRKKEITFIFTRPFFVGIFI